MATEDLLNRLETKLDTIGTRLGRVDVTLATQAEQLGEHMRRTEIAEGHLDRLQLEVNPLTKAHHMWTGVGKAVTILGVIAGIAEVVIRTMQH